jgi:hypothetical protein
MTIRSRIKLSTLEGILAKVAEAASLPTSSLKHPKDVKIQIWNNPELESWIPSCDCYKIHVGLDIGLEDGVLNANTFRIGTNCHCGRVAMTDVHSRQCSAMYSALNEL